MKKSIVIGISIISVFILCSLSYQPIIADTPIETISQVKESKASNLDVDEIEELHTKLLELKFQSKADCGCEDTKEWDYPIFCGLLFNITINIITLMGEILLDFLLGLPFVVVIWIFSIFDIFVKVMIYPFYIICLGHPP